MNIITLILITIIRKRKIEGTASLAVSLSPEGEEMRWIKRERERERGKNILCVRFIFYFFSPLY